MKLKKLRILKLRNITDLTLECDQGIHYIYGSNGQGKTTLLEAISILSHLRSFRDSELQAVLQDGCAQGIVEGEFELSPGTQASLKVELNQTPYRFEKRAYINHKLARSAADYFGVKRNSSAVQFHAIALNPTSTDLMRGEPSLRRNYLNQVISSERPELLDVLKRYQKVVDQKNALLKSETGIDSQLLRILNENIASLGAIVLHFRFDYLHRIQKPISEFLQEIAPHQKGVILEYKISDKNSETLQFHGHFDPPTIKILEANLHQKLEQAGALERARGSSLVGPHRDDFKFKVGQLDLQDVGSQGEIRSVLLALKLTELEEFKNRTQIQPVLLIDDFSSELDSTRRGFLLNYLKDSDLQIFVTSTEILETPGKRIQMKQGWIS